MTHDNYLADTEDDTYSSIFLSVLKDNEEFVRTIVDLLRKGNRKVRIEYQDTPPNTAWLEEIHRRIENYDCFIFVLSSSSVDNVLCNFELDHALQNGKKLFLL